jgi:hypothetical protein
MLQPLPVRSPIVVTPAVGRLLGPQDDALGSASAAVAVLVGHRGRLAFIPIRP